MGDVGRRLLQEIRVNDVKNVFIYDENEEKTSDLVERIELEEMKRKSSILVFVITVANKVVAEEIEERILALNEEAHIYKYIQKDRVFLKGQLEDKECFNEGTLEEKLFMQIWRDYLQKSKFFH